MFCFPTLVDMKITGDPSNNKIKIYIKKIIGNNNKISVDDIKKSKKLIR
tara:strand:- start:605 stop:751 length:147 start_codon:yes stop_codon:yes gene_type:complete